MASSVWGGVTFGPNGRLRSAVDLSLFEAVDPLQRGILPDPGTAVVAGWTTEEGPPVQVRGASPKLSAYLQKLMTDTTSRFATLNADLQQILADRQKLVDDLTASQNS